MMQRWELPAFGRDNLVLTSALRPKPDPKEVLVKVEAVSLTDARAGVKPEALQATARFSLAALTRR
jgi:hypothetical protein